MDRKAHQATARAGARRKPEAEPSQAKGSRQDLGLTDIVRMAKAGTTTAARLEASGPRPAEPGPAQTRTHGTSRPTRMTGAQRGGSLHAQVPHGNAPWANHARVSTNPRAEHARHRRPTRPEPARLNPRRLELWRPSPCQPPNHQRQSGPPTPPKLACPEPSDPNHWIRAIGHGPPDSSPHLG